MSPEESYLVLINAIEKCASVSSSPLAAFIPASFWNKTDLELAGLTHDMVGAIAALLITHLRRCGLSAREHYINETMGMNAANRVRVTLANTPTATVSAPEP